MADVIRMDAEQTRRVRKLVRALCANCDGGNCLLLDDGEPCVCPQLITASLVCRYFRSVVLPADRELLASFSKRRKCCRVCSTPIFAGSNAAKYCPQCAAKERRRLDMERKRKHRSMSANRGLETR